MAPRSWHSNSKFSKEEKCRTPHLREEGTKERFQATFDQLLDGNDALLESCQIMQDHLTNCSTIDAKLDKFLQEIAVLAELAQRCTQENARSAQS